MYTDTNNIKNTNHTCFHVAVVLAPHIHNVNFSFKEIAWPKETTIRDHRTTNKAVARCLQHFQFRFQKYINNLITKPNIYIYFIFWHSEALVNSREMTEDSLTPLSHSVITVNDTYVHGTGAQ